MTKHKTRRVDFAGCSADFDTALLGALGFSSKCITKHTGLTPGQIGYRLKKATIRRQDYRDGLSVEAKTIINQANKLAEPDVRKHIESNT